MIGNLGVLLVAFAVPVALTCVFVGPKVLSRVSTKERKEAVLPIVEERGTAPKTEKRLKRFSFVSQLHRFARFCLSMLPNALLFAFYRRLVCLDVQPSDKLEVKVAETQEELEACFRILHDAYASSNFMKKHPSGLRVTDYHALPSTVTICAKWEGKVVGTISLIRESEFGIPLGNAYDLSSLRREGGGIVEVSSLAIENSFRNNGGVVLFPLFKYIYEYSLTHLNCRHLTVAVNPSRIDLYEAILLFKRLPAAVVDSYDFANGAPAVGATLDLKYAYERYGEVYGKKPLEKNFHQYMCVKPLANLHYPEDQARHVADAPLMKPELLDYFFNQRTQAFAAMDASKRSALHKVYGVDRSYHSVLPLIEGAITVPPRPCECTTFISLNSRFKLIGGRVVYTKERKGCRRREKWARGCCVIFVVHWRSTGLPD